jgi:hypothetical protein
MKPDQRMFFIRNIEDLDEMSSEIITREYEVLTDSYVVGEISFGPYYFTIWEFGKTVEGEKRKLCLRIKEKKLSGNEWDTATRHGFYHGGGIAEEIVALSSLALHGRFILGTIVRDDDKPRIYASRYGYIDGSLIKGKKKIKDLPQFFELIKGLKVEYHLKFILAVRLYHQALLVIEEQPDIAYLNLVSSIETLCQDYPIENVTLSQIDETLANLVKSIENEALMNEIEKAILKKERLINKKFVLFIMEYTENSFWERNDRPEYGRVNPDKFEEILKRIYTQRSKYLHSGEPFPKSIYFAPVANEEIDGASAMMSMDKRWEQKDFIPYPHFFEKLVNHVLINFLRRNQG